MAGKSKNPLEGVLKDIIGKISNKGIPTQEDMAGAWARAVGEGAAKHSKIRSLKSGRLVVNIDDSSWLYELTIRKKELLKKIGEILNSSKIKEITLRIGDIK